MPKDFENCVEAGGKVRRKRVDKDHWMSFCIPPGGSSSIGGEVYRYKKVTKKKKKTNG